MDSVGILIICSKTERFLLMERSSEVNNPHLWSTLTGTMDVEGESPAQTIDREIEEEIGVPTSKIKYKDLVLVTKNYNGRRHFTFVGYSDDEFKPNLNYENSNYKWCTLEDLPSPLHPKVREQLENERLISYIFVDEVSQDIKRLLRKYYGKRNKI